MRIRGRDDKELRVRMALVACPANSRTHVDETTDADGCCDGVARADDTSEALSFAEEDDVGTAPVDAAIDECR